MFLSSAVLLFALVKGVFLFATLFSLLCLTACICCRSYFKDTITLFWWAVVLFAAFAIYATVRFLLFVPLEGGVRAFLPLYLLLSFGALGIIAHVFLQYVNARYACYVLYAFMATYYVFCACCTFDALSFWWQKKFVLVTSLLPNDSVRVQLRFLQGTLATLTAFFWPYACFVWMRVPAFLILTVPVLVLLILACIMCAFKSGAFALCLSLVAALCFFAVAPRRSLLQQVFFFAVFVVKWACLLLLMPCIIRLLSVFFTQKFSTFLWQGDVAPSLVNMGVHWQELLLRLEQKFFWGWGAGVSSVLSRKCFVVPLFFPHNMGLQLWIEGGLAAVLAFVCLWCFWLGKWCRAFLMLQERVVSPAAKPCARHTPLGFAAFTFAFIITGFCVTFFRYPLWCVPFWLCTLYGVLIWRLLWCMLKHHLHDLQDGMEYDA